jgi:hypothetical protein
MALSGERPVGFVSGLRDEMLLREFDREGPWILGAASILAAERERCRPGGYVHTDNERLVPDGHL